MIKDRPIQSAVFQRFTRAYLGTLVFAAVMITALLVGIAANSISQMERDARQAALSQMTADMQLQCEIMIGVRDRIVLADSYQPTMLRTDKYKEIELLENFSGFVNYSPISSSLFLMYSSEDMIYTSNGTKALLRYYCTKTLGLMPEKSLQLRQELMKLRSMQILRMQDYGGNPVLLFAVPVTFTKGVSRENAVLVFEVEEKRLLQRMESVSGHGFVNYAICENNALVTEFGEAAAYIAQPERRLKANEHLLSSTSEDGRFTVIARCSSTAFARVVSMYFWQICGVIAAITIIFVLFAVIAAARTSRPIRQLARRFGDPDSQNAYNEFEILENAIQNIESNHKASVRTARDQFLHVLLHGNGTTRMLEQWTQLGVAFDQPYHCVYIVMIPQGVTAEELIEEIEGFAEDGLRLYAMHPADHAYVAACCSYCYEHTRRELFDNLCALVEADREAVFMGDSYDTPLKLPLSYQEARKARQAQSSYSQQLGLTYEQVNQRLETIRTAVKCSRVDVVEAEVKQLDRIVAASDESVTLQRYIYHSLLSCKVSLLSDHQEPDSTLDSLMVTDYSMMAAELVKALRENQTAFEESHSSSADEIVRFIGRNAQDCDLCLDTLVDEFSLSADYISQLVKNQTGLPFKEYLIRQRMQIAQKLLLEDSAMTINDVAVRSGYRTASNFIKRFRETTGMTPVQFRKSREIPQE